MGCFAIWPLTNRLGRRIALMVCSFIFCIGVVLQVINTGSLPCFYVGRVVSGIGLGGSSAVIPIYMSEMSPKDIRGRLGSCYQLAFTIGIFWSYWVDYGVKSMSASPAQWQIPIGLQFIPAAFMGLGMLTLSESVRWLLSHDREASAWKSLTWVRASASEKVEAEFDEMKLGLEEERRATANFQLSELFERHNAHSILIGFTLFLAQQSTGSTALAYFGPQFFTQLVGGEGSTRNLLLTAIFGAIKVAACLGFVLLISERFGRRTLLGVGALFMSACMIATAAVDKTRPPPGGGEVTSPGIATVALIYLDIIAYNLSWGPLPWPCASEILTTRIREVGMAIAAGSQWLFNFVYSFSTPYMLEGMGWGTFLFYGILDLFIAAFVWFAVEETRGRTLEDINDSIDHARLVSSSSGTGEADGQDPQKILSRSESGATDHSISHAHHAASKVLRSQ